MFKFVHSICFVSVESITLLYQNQAKTMPRYKKKLHVPLLFQILEHVIFEIKARKIKDDKIKPFKFKPFKIKPFKTLPSRRAMDNLRIH